MTVKPYGPAGGDSTEGVVFFANDKAEFDTLSNVQCKDEAKDDNGLFESPLIQKAGGAVIGNCKPATVSKVL